MSTESLNPLVNAQKQIKAACDLLGLDPAVYEMLKSLCVSWRSPFLLGWTMAA